MGKRNLLITVFILLVVGLGAYFYFQGFQIPFQNQKKGNEVVARVNGSEIIREDLDAQVAQFEQNLASQGQNAQLDNEEVRSQIERQALDQLIAQELILQEAESAGFTASEEEVNQEYQNIVGSVGGENALTQRLDEAGISTEDLRDSLKDQIVIQKYITSKIEEQGFEITDEEIGGFYDEWSQGQDDAPPLEEVEEQIRQELASQGENEYISNLISELRESATIEILL